MREHSREPEEWKEAVQVIVYQKAERTVGLIVDEIRDIVEDHVEVQPGSGSPGFIGSAVIQGKITDLLDMAAIIRAAERAA